MSYPSGVDVSSFQSATYSTKGLSYVFVKATQGTTYTNPKHSAQISHGRAAGLVVGHYHFLVPGNPQGQAAYFAKHAGVQPGDLLACDWEPLNGITPSNSDKDAFLAAVKKLFPKNRVLLYCDVSRWTSMDKTGDCGDGLWIATAGKPEGKPGIKDPWMLHQYSTAGGIDHDAANFTTTTALLAWAKGEDPDMPLTGADAKTILETDNIIKSPTGAAVLAKAGIAASNTYITEATAHQIAVQNAVEANLSSAQVLALVTSLTAQVAALNTEMAALKAAQADPAAFSAQVVAEIKTALSGITFFTP